MWSLSLEKYIVVGEIVENYHPNRQSNKNKDGKVRIIGRVWKYCWKKQWTVEERHWKKWKNINKRRLSQKFTKLEQNIEIEVV